MMDERYLAVAAALFVLGALGFLTRRNLILMILSVELMLHGVSLTLVTFSQVHHNLEGQVLTIFILTIAACEAGLALALILVLYQRHQSLDVQLWSELREAELGPPTRQNEDDELPISRPAVMEFPRLTPAGPAPDIHSIRGLRPPQRPGGNGAATQSTQLRDTDQPAP